MRPAKKAVERRSARGLAWLWLALALSGCGDPYTVGGGESSGGGSSSAKYTHSQFAADSVDNTTQFVDALETVTDKRSAESAASKIKGLADRLRTIAGRAKGMKAKLSDEERTQIQATFREKFAEQQKRMEEQVIRLRQIPEVKAALDEAIKSYLDAIQSVQLAGLDRKLADGPEYGPDSGSGGPASGSGQPRPAPANGPPQPQQLVSQFGADRVVTVTVQNVPLDRTGEVAFSVRQSAGVQSMTAKGQGTVLTVVVAPVDDIEALASKLTIGRVTGIDKSSRTITVDAGQ